MLTEGSGPDKKEWFLSQILFAAEELLRLVKKLNPMCVRGKLAVNIACE